MLINLTKILANQKNRTLEITEILRIALQMSSSSLCLEKDGNLSYGPKTNTEIFKDFYLNLENNLVKKLPSPPNKFENKTVKTYYQRLNLGRKAFSLQATITSAVQKLLEDINPS